MAAHPDLTARLLRLGAGERDLLCDLYNMRFASDAQICRLRALAGGAPAERLCADGLARREDGPAAGGVWWLSRTGARAAQTLVGRDDALAARPYAVLLLEHELLRGALYLALRERGMKAVAYRAEARLDFRSAAAPGERTLVPDACVDGPAGTLWLLEVDRATESARQLRRKWLRYREWAAERGDAWRLGVLSQNATRAEWLRASLAGARLAGLVSSKCSELADEVMGTPRSEQLFEADQDQQQAGDHAGARPEPAAKRAP